MRYLISTFFLLAVALPVLADPGDKDGKKGGDPYAGMREQILKEFDKDGDGKLSEEEREAARGKVRELRMAAAKEQGDKPAEKSARRDGRPGPGPGGPPGRPKREEAFAKFDKDNDGELSDDERQNARDKMRELRGDRGERGRGERGEGRGREARRGPGGPGGPEGRRGPGGPPMLPKPEELFTKFDKDNDEKLSKDEFKELTDFVHEHMPPPPMAGPRGPGGRPPEGRVLAQRGPEGPRFRDGDGPRFRDGEEPGPRFRDGERPRFREGEGPGRWFRGPDGPPPRDGERGREFRRPDGPPPGDGPEARGDGPRDERRHFERDGRRGPPRDDDDDDYDRPAKHSKGDKADDKDDKADSAI